MRLDWRAGWGFEEFTAAIADEFVNHVSSFP
jgi:hypothetical protein